MELTSSWLVVDFAIFMQKEKAAECVLNKLHQIFLQNLAYGKE